jgi:hypothetical protein
MEKRISSETSRTMKTAKYRASEFALLNYCQEQLNYCHEQSIKVEIKNARNNEMLCGQTVDQPGSWHKWKVTMNMDLTEMWVLTTLWLRTEGI